MGRPKKKGKRTPSGQFSRSLEALTERTEPAPHIIAKRELWAFVRPSAGPDGRTGTIDQDVCDSIGQLHALGMLDDAGHNPQYLRDAARFYADHYRVRYHDTLVAASAFERHDRSTSSYLGATADDRRFDQMDAALTGYERETFTDLVVDEALGEPPTAWALAIIGEGLRKRGKLASGYPTADDFGRLEAAIRGLLMIVGVTPVRLAA